MSYLRVLRVIKILYEYLNNSRMTRSSVMVRPVKNQNCNTQSCETGPTYQASACYANNLRFANCLNADCVSQVDTSGGLGTSMVYGVAVYRGGSGTDASGPYVDNVAFRWAGQHVGVTRYAELYGMNSNMCTVVMTVLNAGYQYKSTGVYDEVLNGCVYENSGSVYGCGAISRAVV